MNKYTLKGYLFVALSVLAMANVYIFSKASLDILHLSQFGVFWFGFAIILNLTLNSKNVSINKFRLIKREKMKYLLLIGFLELIATSAFFSAINSMDNPAIVSFFSNSTPVFVSILAVIFLKERFNKTELIGIMFAISGSFIIAYNPGLELKGNFYRALFLILFSGFTFAVSTIFSKKNINDLPPGILTLNRTLFLFFASVIYLIISKHTIIIPVSSLIYITLGSFLGPFLAAFAGYSALKYIEASRVSVLGSSKAFFVLITSYLYFRILPTHLQLLGGFITILGVFLISFGKIIKTKRVHLLKRKKSVNVRKL